MSGNGMRAASPKSRIRSNGPRPPSATSAARSAPVEPLSIHRCPCRPLYSALLCHSSLSICIPTHGLDGLNGLGVAHGDLDQTIHADVRGERGDHQLRAEQEERREEGGGRIGVQAQRAHDRCMHATAINTMSMRTADRSKEHHGAASAGRGAVRPSVVRRRARVIACVCMLTLCLAGSQCATNFSAMLNGVLLCESNGGTEVGQRQADTTKGRQRKERNKKPKPIRSSIRLCAAHPTSHVHCHHSQPQRTPLRQQQQQQQQSQCTIQSVSNMHAHMQLHHPDTMTDSGAMSQWDCCCDQRAGRWPICQRLRRSDDDTRVSHWSNRSNACNCG